MEAAGSHEELRGLPGAVTRYEELHQGAGGEWAYRASADACCPGCGDQVVSLDPDSQPVVGSAHTLTCPAVVRFFCCGWEGRLDDGLWRPLSPGQNGDGRARAGVWAWLRGRSGGR